MKIDKIQIRNFKVFKDFIIDFNSCDTIVFDGPNGFGKTTIYDAIELLITGEIRRYKTLKDELIDKRQTFLENPFFHEGAIHGENISIQIQFIKDDVKYILERTALSDQIKSNLDFGIYKLYIKKDFESKEYTQIVNEKDFLTNLFGVNYDRNFQFLNYVEQEESLFLLKNSDKKRKDHIAHLFDLNEFELKIKRIEEVKKRIDLLCSKIKKAEIDELEGEIKSIKNSLLTDTSIVQYSRIFPNKEYTWDLENPDFKTIDYYSISGEDGLLEKLKSLVKRKDIFRKHRKNSAINYLIENVELVHDYFKFANFIELKDNFREKRNELTSLQSVIQQLKELNNENLANVIDLTNYSFLSEEIKFEFSSEREQLQNLLVELTGLDKIYADISLSRNLLKDKLLTLKNNEVANGECLFCGYDWGEVDELINQIEIKALKIKEINSFKTTYFTTRFSQFKSGLLQDIINLINNKISEISFDNNFVNDLLKIEVNSYTQLLYTFSFVGIDIQRFINLLPNANAQIKTSEFIEEITIIKENIQEELIEPYYQEIFKKYFDGNHDSVDKLTLGALDQKLTYLKYLWNIKQNELLNIKSSKLRTMTQKYTDASNISSNLNVLKNKYNGSLKSFQKKIIKDIEIIFHVYSGRIMQCFQGGLGLFIFSEKEGIRFQSNPNKTYDAIFSMSSGQLSALIISFTLALHKKYATNKLILIDDPVQTMDELNLYGFIDLLRNEFYDNQIIMSTHEDMMSAFMRYKFKNYNLSEKRVNLKESQQY
nr:AAA family ATPase [uncultured Sphingobacterium sp.]